MNRSARRAAEVSASKTKQQFFAAIEHHRAGRLVEAERLYRAIISSGFPIAEAHNNLGFLLHQRGDSVGALAEYRKAVAINPTDPGALANLGNALRDLDNIEANICAYRGAVPLASASQCKDGLGFARGLSGFVDQHPPLLFVSDIRLHVGGVGERGRNGPTGID